MSDLFIYCLTSKQYNLFKYLPSNIIPLGLGDNIYPENFLNEKSGINISKHNKNLAEMTGIYWVYKNQIKKFKKGMILYKYILILDTASVLTHWTVQIQIDC